MAPILGTCSSLLGQLRQWLGGSALAARLARGTVWSMAGGLISRGLALLATVYVARYLGRVAYGEFSMLQGTAGVFGTFAGLGLTLTANKYVAECRADDPCRAGRIIALSQWISLLAGVFTAGLLYLTAPWFAARVLAAPHLTGALRLASPLALLEALASAQAGALGGFEAFRRIAQVNLWVGVSAVPLLVGGAHLAGLPGVLGGLVANQALQCLLNGVQLRQELRQWGVRLDWTGALRERRVLWHFSLPAFLGTAMVGPATWICNAVVVNQVDGYAALGVYSAAVRITRMVQLLQGLCGAVLLPVLCSTKGRPTAALSSVNILSSWMIGLVMILPLMSFPETFGLLFGQEFAQGDAQLSYGLVLFACALASHRQGISRSFAAASIMWWSPVSNAVWGGICLAATWIWRGHGHVGRAGADVLAYALVGVVFLPLYVRKRLCPRPLLYSLPALVVWWATLQAAIVPLLTTSPAPRVLNLIAVMALAGGGLWWLWRRRSEI